MDAVRKSGAEVSVFKTEIALDLQTLGSIAHLP